MIDLTDREFVGGGEWMDSGEEERFISVNIPNAGDEILIEQGGLDGAGGLPEKSCQAGGFERERLRAEIAIGGFFAQPEDAAKTAWIAEADLNGAVAEIEDQVGVGLERRAGIFECELAGHAEVNVKAITVGKGDDDSLGAAIYRGDGPAGEQGGQIDVGGGDDIGTMEDDGGDFLACDSGAKGGDDGLYFGKFGHMQLL